MSLASDAPPALDYGRPDLERSFRRSRVRQRVLFALHELGVAHPAELAEVARVSHRRLRAVMEGHPPFYAPELGLAELGLATQVRTRTGVAFAITPRGREWLVRGRLVAPRARREMAGV